jgi:hypothetical protein
MKHKTKFTFDSATCCISFAVIGLITGAISSYQSIFKVTPLVVASAPFESILRPVCIFLAIVIGIIYNKRYLSVFALFLSIIQIYFIGDRSGDGMSDGSHLTQIRFAQQVYSASLLFDISAIIFIISSIISVFAVSNYFTKTRNL